MHYVECVCLYHDCPTFICNIDRRIVSVKIPQHVVAEVCVIVHCEI